MRIYTVGKNSVLYDALQEEFDLGISGSGVDTESLYGYLLDQHTTIEDCVDCIYDEDGELLETCPFHESAENLSSRLSVLCDNGELSWGTTITMCNGCGGIFNTARDIGNIIDNRHICIECLENGQYTPSHDPITATCSMCAKKFNIPTRSMRGRNAKVLSIENRICIDCLCQHFCLCAYCNNIVKKTETKSILSHRNGERTICFPCVRIRDIFWCTRCTHFVEQDDAYGDYCAICVGSRAVRAYNYNPLLALKFLPPRVDMRTLYFGVELEIETPDRGAVAAKILSLNNKFSNEENWFILKHDGSLSRGCEIVSRPAIFNIHKEVWHSLLPELSSQQFADKVHISEKCGMHVHISKTALTRLQICKMLVFVTHISNRKLINFIAGREPNRYCKIHNKKPGDALRQPAEKYEALNILPRETVEFRIFDGTIDPDRVVRNLEFCHALIMYTRPCNTTYLDMYSSEKFIKFIVSHKRDYPHLSALFNKQDKKKINNKKPKKGIACV